MLMCVYGHTTYGGMCKCTVEKDTNTTQQGTESGLETQDAHLATCNKATMLDGAGAPDLRLRKTAHAF